MYLWSLSKKTAPFSGTPNFFGPSYFESAVISDGLSSNMYNDLCSFFDLIYFREVGQKCFRSRFGSNEDIQKTF